MLFFRNHNNMVHQICITSLYYLNSVHPLAAIFYSFSLFLVNVRRRQASLRYRRQRLNAVFVFGSSLENLILYARPLFIVNLELIYRILSQQKKLEEKISSRYNPLNHRTMQDSIMEVSQSIHQLITAVAVWNSAKYVGSCKVFRHH